MFIVTHKVLLGKKYNLINFTLSSINIDKIIQMFHMFIMQVLINFKVDSRMRAALKKLAEKQFISVSAAVKQAIDKYLKENGIDWREETGEESTEK